MKVVKLRVYKGSEVLYSAEGTVKNQNQYVKLIHGTLEWKNYLKYILIQNYCKVEVISLIDLKSEKELDIENVQKEVNEANLKNKKAPMTKEQQEIAELKEQVKALVGGAQIPNKETPKPEIKKEVDPELEKLRAEYEEVVGKKPHHKSTADSMKKAIEENK